VAGFCERGNEPSGSICGEFIDRSVKKEVNNGMNLIRLIQFDSILVC
jgi:hypothetical protein